MAATLQTTDTIERSGFPLCFKVSEGARRPRTLGLGDARDVFKVEARALGGHQKEAVVTEGETGSAWRMVSDEGPGLKGTDLAPFPLGFMSAGLQADLENRIARVAATRGTDVSRLATELVNDYAFEGSFFKGDGRGFAYPPRLLVRLRTTAEPAGVRRIVDDALAASPLVAAWRAPLINTFSLYVNGRRRPLATLSPSMGGDATDPLKAWKRTPQPLAGARVLPALIEKAGPVAATADSPKPAAWQGGRVDIGIHGTSTIDSGVTRSITWGNRLGGSRFGIASDERDDHDLGPSGLALGFAGVAFCLMTQLLRYVEHHEMNLRALRIVQLAPCEMRAGGAIAQPLDTHVFVHADETEETIERLLRMAANTCYLHAALHSALEPVVVIEANGAILSP